MALKNHGLLKGGENMQHRYTVLFTDGTIDYILATDKCEAYELAIDKFIKTVADIWLD